MPVSIVSLCLIHSKSCINFTLYQTTKFLTIPKLKVLADDKLNVAEILKFVLEREENIVGKGENAGYHHFLLFSQCFQVFSFAK